MSTAPVKKEVRVTGRAVSNQLVKPTPRKGGNNEKSFFDVR